MIEARLAAQLSENRYRSLFDNARDAIFTIATDGTFTSLNPAVEAMAGISRAEWLGKPFGPMVHPADLPKAMHMFQCILRGERAPVHELRGHPGLPRYAVMEMTLTPQKDENGTTIGVLGIGRDITERKQTEAEMEGINRKLVEFSRSAGMAEIATNVLHNIGNALNSVNISSDLIQDLIRKSKTPSLRRVAGLLEEHAHDLGAFITTDVHGKHVPAHLSRLSEHLMAEQARIGDELALLRRNIEHIKGIVAMQQSYASVGGGKESTDLSLLAEDSLRLNEEALDRHGVKVVREYEKVPLLNVEKHKILQILVNLVRNAKHACDESGKTEKQITMRVTKGKGTVRMFVEDNGVGIPAENLTRIFNFGFTTRNSGHGFGLHSSVLAAKEMGGLLTVCSGGLGYGTTFMLELPCPDESAKP